MLHVRSTRAQVQQEARRSQAAISTAVEGALQQLVDLRLLDSAEFTRASERLGALEPHTAIEVLFSFGSRAQKGEGTLLRALAASRPVLKVLEAMDALGRRCACADDAWEAQWSARPDCCTGTPYSFFTAEFGEVHSL